MKIRSAFIELLHAGRRTHKHAESSWTDKISNMEKYTECCLTKITGYVKKRLTFENFPFMKYEESCYVHQHTGLRVKLINSRREGRRTTS